jgi:glutathione S-transferase
MSQPDAKRQKTAATHELLYWPGIPGRAEFVRLAFEATKTPYIDVSNASKDGVKETIGVLDDVEGGNPPGFAPPTLRVAGEGRDGKALVVHQTPNILLHLGPKLGLVPDDEPGRLWVHELTLTALDCNNEVHDTHHPVAVSAYYEGIVRGVHPQPVVYSPRR